MATLQMRSKLLMGLFLSWLIPGYWVKWPIVIKWTDMYILVLLLLWFGNKKLIRESLDSAKHSAALLWAWCLLIMWCIASMLWATNPGYALFGAIDWMKIFLLFLATNYLIKSEEDIKKILLVFILAISLREFLRLSYLSYLILESGNFWIRRSTLFAGMGIMMINGLLLHSEIRLRWAFLSALILSVAVVVTLERTTWIALFLALLAQYLLTVRFRNFKLMIAGKPIKTMCVSLSLTLIAAVIISLSFPPIFHNAIGRVHGLVGMVTTMTVYTGDMQRWQLDTMSYNMFRAHPITGVGVWNFSAVKAEYASSDTLAHIFEASTLVPENFYVRSLAELGLIGFLLLLILIFMPMKLISYYRRYKSTYKYPGVLLSVIGIWFYSLPIYAFHGFETDSKLLIVITLIFTQYYKRINKPLVKTEEVLP